MINSGFDLLEIIEKTQRLDFELMSEIKLDDFIELLISLDPKNRFGGALFVDGIDLIA